MRMVTFKRTALALVAAAGAAAEACTGFYVGKKVSADGTTVTALADGYDAADMRSDERFCPAVAAAHFRRLGALAEADRRLYGDGVRAFWRTCEDRWMAEFPKIVRAGDAAAITAYAVDAQRAALADAKRIFDELSWYLVKMNFNRGDYGDPKKVPQRRPFVPSAD